MNSMPYVHPYHSNLPFDMLPSDEFATPVWSTNLIHTAPYVYNIQAVLRTGLRDFIIDGVDGQVQVNLVQALDLLG